MKHERPLLQRSVLAVAAASVAVLLAALAVPHPVHAQTDSLVLEANGNVGIGLETPERQLHISGANAQVRIDRPVDATSFQLVRTTSGGDVLKSFVFGVLASGPDNGSFFIRDNAQQTGGSTPRVRMQINNAGNTTFQGTVSAVGFNSTSAARFKTDVMALSDADASLQQLRGVRFNWKETGTPSLGLIAEEVAAVYPELVQFDAETGAAEAVNYAALVAVLIEGYKEQQLEIAGYQSRVEKLERQQAELATLRAQVAAIEHLLVYSQPVAQR